MNFFDTKAVLALAVALITAPIGIAGEGTAVASPDAAVEGLISSEAQQARQDHQQGPPELAPKDTTSALARKDMELKEARAEIRRLRQWIESIQAASRQEQYTLYYNMGCVYRANKLPAKAEESFLKALELNASDPALHYNMGILYDDDLNKADKARRHYIKFLELSTDELDRARVQEWLSSLK
jgi:tetratricopeptide (TPR) repeat protein